MKPSDLARFDPAAGSSYLGGKSGSGVYQRIINLMSPHQVYMEPFLGGGAILKRKLPAQLNIGLDLDPDVIACWKSAAPLNPPTTAAGGDPADRRRSTADRALLPATSADPASPLPPSRDRATVDRHAGPDVSATAAGLQLASAVTSAVAGDRWDFRCACGIDFLRQYPFTGRELVYCDPPYLHATRRDLHLYQYELTAAQHRELLHVVRKIPAPVIISGYQSDLYQSQLERRGWNVQHFQAMTRRGVATETLWYNFPEPLELHDYRFLGKDRRERQNIKRKCQSWTTRLAKMGRLERQALLAALVSTGGEDTGGTRLNPLNCTALVAAATSIQFRKVPSLLPSSSLLLRSGRG